MSMFKITAIGAIAGFAAIVGLAFNHSAAEKAGDIPVVGTPISEAEIAAWNISIMPDGAGLPAGSGAVSAGAEVFTAQCAICHGENAVGGPAGSLAGGIGSLASAEPVKSVGSFWPYATTLYDYVRRAMPYFAPGSLSDDDAYAVTAYILYVNNIIEEDTVLDAQSLPLVEMPNRDGFIAYWPAPPK